ncbi:flagellar motor switch protein FliN [Phycicoccus avicenniae]|uniref:flagellar motor switch protein FliN n=1 Tax=Phycicoccus avicenniae TaxID=2828860 RepID=UPI003D26CE64
MTHDTPQDPFATETAFTAAPDAAFGASGHDPVPAATPVAAPAAGGVDPRRLHLLREVELGISVELGRSRMTVREVLGLAPGAVVELDRPAGSPVDVLVNGTLMARGEVVVVDDEYAVRVTEVVSSDPSVGLGA